MKGERTSQLELILKSHPEGLRKSDIARRMGVHRSTVGRYIDELKQYSEVYEQDGLVKIKSTEPDENISLSVYESMALNMGAEIILSQSQYQNPHLASALRKIAMNMSNYAPKISSSINASAEEIEKRSVVSHNSVFEVLVDAWISGRMVRVVHRQYSDEEEEELAPYFIGFVEGEGGRNPITVTGRLRHTTEVVTIDLNKISSVEVLDETYTIPDNLKAFNRRENPQVVTDVVDTIPLELTVKEKSALNSFRSLAHGPIQTSRQPDGSMRCRFDAENSIELILRIIQCMDSVEIVGPQKFRNRFVSILRQILAQYS